WRFLDEAANLSRTTFLCALAERDELEALRVVRVWLRYFRRLRRRYVESNWTFELDANETSNRQKRRENLETLEKIEAASVDLRRLRVGIVESRDWTPDEARLLSVDVEAILGRSKETSGENKSNGEEKPVGEVATDRQDGKVGETGEFGEDRESGEDASAASVRTERETRRFWRRWIDRLKEKAQTTQSTQAAQKTENKEERESGEGASPGRDGRIGGESAEAAKDNERRRERLEATRRAFAKLIANDPKARVLFVDLTICVRAVERRLLAGDWETANPLSWALDKLTDLYFENGAISLAAEETIAASRRLATLEPPNDAEILTSWSALWQLQAATLRLAERKIEDGDERLNVANDDKRVENSVAKQKNVANDAENANEEGTASKGNGTNELSAAEAANVASRGSRRCETFDAEIERAFQEAFDASLRATQDDGPGAALSKIRLGEIGAAYLHWLTSKSRGDEAWAFVSAAGAELESRSDLESPIDLFALGWYLFGDRDGGGRVATSGNARRI
ncbi:MAG: hypothetical protein IKK39_09015, partial [Thermoguttaceae bacterium]|nr:hypothetical protein [Thermoguttaceae bacterium]